MKRYPPRHKRLHVPRMRLTNRLTSRYPINAGSDPLRKWWSMAQKTRIAKKLKPHSDPRKEDEPPELVLQPEMTSANREAPEM